MSHVHQYYCPSGIDAQKTLDAARAASVDDSYRDGHRATVHQHGATVPCKGQQHTTYEQGEAVQDIKTDWFLTSSSDEVKVLAAAREESGDDFYKDARPSIVHYHGVDDPCADSKHLTFVRGYQR